MSYNNTQVRWDSTDSLPEPLKLKVKLLRSLKQVKSELSKDPGGSLQSNILVEIDEMLNSHKETSATRMLTLETDLINLNSRNDILERELSKRQSRLDNVVEQSKEVKKSSIGCFGIVSILIFALGVYVGAKYINFPRDATIPEEKVVPSLKH